MADAGVVISFRFCSGTLLLAILLSATAMLLPTESFADDPDKAALLALYQRQSFQADAGVLPYRLLAPAKVEPGKKYPLVLFLHGAGERGEDNESQLVHGASEFAKPDRRNQYPAYVVFPQCPKEQRWVESDWDLKSGEGQFPSKPSLPMQLALGLVDQLIDEQPVDSNRCYVTGLSMGGMGTWFAAASEPKRFAAMLEVCGGGDPSWANRYQGIPIWCFHGQSDRVVPVERGREMIVALTLSGQAPEIRYVEYPGVGHNSWTQTFARDDIYDWLFAQERKQK
ncbi:prolyl oligopeptidase family serine peptidase [Planctomycetes bacterium K23_9]|uniref:Phospholipase/Carboxylesterase n=1 Tax=Stieleria marina TaxID=1930275 RepID=A0A517P1X9_9BACT|nr:Phospholipase/Carboxylesterase [Planctomycetes bacterium K23_9]